MSKRYSFLAVTLIVTATCALGLSSRAQTTNTLVHDTWQDSTRTDPASPVYAENNGVTGTDADADGDLESAWFEAGTANMAPSPNSLLMSNGATSASYITYFTPEGSEVNLANPGDTLRVKWVFTPTGLGGANTSQNLPLAIVNTPNAATRLTADGSVPASTAYAGYAMFMNMSTPNLGNSGPFQLREWNGSGSALLGTSGNWNILTNQTASGVHGYDNGTQYTFLMTLTRDATGSLDINATMSGGSIGGGGVISVTFTDATPNSFSYDTLDLRPASAVGTATNLNTSLFQVDFIQQVPEPSSIMLVGAGFGLMLTLACRRRS